MKIQSMWIESVSECLTTTPKDIRKMSNQVRVEPIFLKEIYFGGLVRKFINGVNNKVKEKIPENFEDKEVWVRRVVLVFIML